MHEISRKFLGRYRPTGSADWQQRQADQIKRVEKQSPIISLAELNREELVIILNELAEPSYQEVATSSFLADFLLQAGLAISEKTGVAPYQTELLFSSGQDSKTALRCDMDAVSTESTCQHSCGHAINMAAVASLGRQLARESIGNISLIFQPAEEGSGNQKDGYVHPRGFGGGQYLREKGIYREFDQLLSCHIDTALQNDEVRISEGVATAAAYRFEHLAKGTPAHAALPWQGKNPIGESLRFWQDVERLNDSMNSMKNGEYGLISISEMQTSSKELNSLAAWCRSAGITRIVGENALSEMRKFLDSNGATFELEAPPVINEVELARIAKEVAHQNGFKIKEEPARFRDETAWAGPFKSPWADPSLYPAGCERILHFFTPAGRKTSGLHTAEFAASIEAIEYQIRMLRGIITSL